MHLTWPATPPAPARMRTIWTLAVAGVLVGCQGNPVAGGIPAPAYPEFDARGDACLLPRPPKKLGMAAEENVLLPGVTDTEFFVLRDARALADLRARFGFPEWFREAPLDFSRETILGVIGAPTRQQVGMHLYRATASPEGVTAHAIAFSRGERDTEATPYFFGRFPRVEGPVHFYLNDAYAACIPPQPFAPGMHREVFAERTFYAAYVPLGLTARAPLVVFLHGSTNTGDVHIGRFVEAADRLKFVVLSVTNRNGYYWQESLDYPALLEAIQRVRGRCPIDPARIFIGGASAGGHTAYDIALKNRERFAGLFSHCGRLNPSTPDDLVAKAKGMPVFIMSGDADEMVPIKAVIAGKERLEKAGADVTFHVIPGGGHPSPWEPENLKHLFAWLEARFKVEPPPAHPPR